MHHFEPLDIGTNEGQALLKRITKQDITLFLGSGFSLGAISSRRDKSMDYMPVPSVKDLKFALANDILYDSEAEALSLKELCEECQADNNAAYLDLMRNFFTVREHKPHHEMYADIGWNKIYTTNVDNLLECVYKKKDRNLASIYGNEAKRTNSNDTVLIKLHGDALRAAEDIIFSNFDYTKNAATHHDCRFEELSRDMKTENFLFIGTTLNDEWDIELSLQQYNVGKPSNKVYFVFPTCDKYTLNKIARRFPNAVFIQETAESFIRKVQDYLDSTVGDTDKATYHFNKYHLREISKDTVAVPPDYLKPDLYLGNEPTWEDIFSHHDVVWNKTKEVHRQIKLGAYLCHVIVGKPISGKTVMLYRLGVELSKDNMVMEYEGEKFDEDIRHLISQYNIQDNQLNDCYILIDNAEWLLGQLPDTLHIIATTGLKLILCVRESEFQRKQHLFDNSCDKIINFITGINHITHQDAMSFLEKLEEKTFLGTWSREYSLSKHDAAKRLMTNFKKSDHLLSLLYNIKDGRQLEPRLENYADKINESPNYNMKRFIVMLYLMDCIGNTPLKLSMFLDLYPMSSEMLDQFLSDVQELSLTSFHVDAVKNTKFSRIKIHSRFSGILEKAIRKMPADQKCEIIIDILNRYNDIHYFQIRQPRTYQNFVVYTMLRSQNLSKLCRTSRNVDWDSVDKVYFELHDSFRDHHIYWLHRSIAEMKMSKYDEAQIHLDQAEVTRRNYSHEIEHTIALLNFELAIHDSRLTAQEKEKKMLDAQRIIEAQINREENDAYSLHTMVIKTIQYYRSINVPMERGQLGKLINCYYKTRDRFPLQDSRIRRNMLISIYKYLEEYNMLFQETISLHTDEYNYLQRQKNLNIDDAIIEVMDDAF